MTLVFDAVLRAPLFGTAALCFAISVLGVLLFIRRRSLVGEVLSHASYPGVTLAIFFAPWLSFGPTILVFATLFALLGFWVVHLLKTQLGIKEDAALTFVLATFFGMGTLLASIVQATHPTLFRQIPVYLYGQAATIQDSQMLLYGFFAKVVCSFVFVFYRPLQLLSFDPNFAKISRLPVRLLDGGLILLVSLCVVLGMRALGVILLAAMMVAPATAARQYTNNLFKMLMIAALFGMGSGFAGTLLSLTGLPTGPCIVLISCLGAILSLLFAPKRGLLFRGLRICRFKMKIQQENVIKALWHHRLPKAPFWLWWRLRVKGWVDAHHHLTKKGERKGAHVVRLHRLWEAYLVSSLGMGTDQVHSCAEEMEHVLTPELEAQLTQLLDDPTYDPHAKPIPAPVEVLS